MERTADTFFARAFLILLMACVMCAAVILGVHALQQHGDDAQAVRQCANDPNNLLAIWQQADGRCHNIVSLPGHEREAGDMITAEGKDGLQHEVTSLIPRCGVLCQIEKWLTDKGAVKTWPK